MKISILLVTYNHERYIKKAVESILMQVDCPDYELVAVDDHSSDGTPSILAGMLENRSNTYLHSNQTNKGITKNYQHGFSLCKGEYIFVLEGDDYWTDPLKLKKITAFLDENPVCVLCAHPFYSQQEDLGIFTHPVVSSNDRYDLFDCRDLILDSSIISNFSTCCYRRSILEKIPAATYETISYDWMINISVAQHGFLGRINTPMSVYRISAGGEWSKRSRAEQLNGMIRIIPEYDRILEYRYTDHFREKQRLLTRELNGTPKPKKAGHSIKAWLPPFLIAILKALTPPVLLDYLRRAFRRK